MPWLRYRAYDLPRPDDAAGRAFAALDELRCRIHAEVDIRCAAERVRDARRWAALREDLQRSRCRVKVELHDLLAFSRRRFLNTRTAFR